MMKNFRTDKIVIDDTQINFASNVPVGEILRLFETTAFKHSDDVGLDHATMLEKSNAFWVVCKIKLNLISNITSKEKLSVKTWIPAPSLIRADRFGTIKSKNKIKAKIISEWCCLDQDTHRIRKMSTIKYPDIEIVDKSECKLKFYNSNPQFSPKDYVYTKTILSSDIDLNMHTNNLKYNTIAMDAFTVEEQQHFDIKEYEIHFLNESHEGDQIDVFKQKKGNFYYVEGRTKEKTIFRVIIKVKQKSTI